MNDKVKKYYQKFRESGLGGIVGKDAKNCLRSAKILHSFENNENVRISVFHEEENYFDVYGEPDTEKEKQTIIDAITLHGLYCVTSEKKCKSCGSWELVDSIGMCIYDDPTNPFENDYVIDLMDSALKN